jgi:ubiquinone/menaquinone biosynthesis C-methylase UbiE
MKWLRKLMGKSSESVKADSEFSYWNERHQKEGTLSNDHFEKYYTSHFELSHDDYRDKKVLDIGCGPRGSLEWASMAKERVGLDPLADTYKKLGTDKHAMRYVASGSETIPFDDGHFDIVCSFNSLDHVDDLDKTIAEIVRVVAPGGTFLLLTDLHDEPTECEPVVFGWEIVQRFTPPLELVKERRYEKKPEGLYQSIDAGVLFDEKNSKVRYGVVSARYRKPTLQEK